MAELTDLKSVLEIVALNKFFPFLKACKVNTLRAFVFSALCISASNVTGAECPTLSIDQQVTVSRVVDGDTLRLRDGRRLRLPNINTPEIGRDGRADQPLAQAAKQAVESFFRKQNSVGISITEQGRDRYGRLVAHVIHPQLGNLESYLVKMGLAFPIAVPPQLKQTPCLLELADQARQQKLGVWGNDYWRALDVKRLDNIESAFRRVCGRITKIDRAGSWWFETDGDLVIQITSRDAQGFLNSQFDLRDARSWQGKSIELWGWLQDRRNRNQTQRKNFKPWSVQARSPYVMRWVDSCD